MNMSEWAFLIPIVPFGVLLLYVLYEIGRDISIRLRQKTIRQQWKEFKKHYPNEYRYMKKYGRNDPDEIIENYIREIA